MIRQIEEMQIISPKTPERGFANVRGVALTPAQVWKQSAEPWEIARPGLEKRRFDPLQIVFGDGHDPLRDLLPEAPLRIFVEISQKHGQVRMGAVILPQVRAVILP